MKTSKRIFSSILFLSSALALSGCEWVNKIMDTLPIDEATSEETEENSIEKPSSNPDDGITIEKPIQMVKINGLFWATTNLDKNVEGSRCYNGIDQNCEQYGRVYTFAQAMGVDQIYDRTVLRDIKYPHQGICPEGTYLPSHKQWNDLVNYLEIHPKYKGYFTNQVGGAFDYKGYFRSIKVETVFWSSSQYEDQGYTYAADFAWVWAFRDDVIRSIVTDNAHKITGGYVRCVKDAK